jgi:hypothetical protein
MAQAVLATLAQHEEIDFQGLSTGDKTWIFSENHHDTAWLASWEEPDEFHAPIHHQKKSMVAILFNGVGQFYIDVLRQKQKMNSAYLTERILSRAAEMGAREETIPKENLTVYFDNAQHRDGQRNVDTVEYC